MRAQNALARSSEVHNLDITLSAQTLQWSVHAARRTHAGHLSMISIAVLGAPRVSARVPPPSFPPPSTSRYRSGRAMENNCAFEQTHSHVTLRVSPPNTHPPRLPPLLVWIWLK